MALRLVAAAASLPGGPWLVSGFGHTSPPPEAAGSVAGIRCAARFGASVGTGAAREAGQALPALGAGLLEIGPVSIGTVDGARHALRSARLPVALRVAGDDALEVVAAIGSHATLVILDLTETASGLDPLNRVRELVSVPVLAGITSGVAVPPHVSGVVLRDASAADVEAALAAGRTVIATTNDASPSSASALVAAGAEAVLVTSTGLVEAGPGWFHRATEAHLARTAPESANSPAAQASWIAGLALGVGMIAGGVGAAVVALGPVLLPYDAAFLRVDANGLAALNPRLIHFLQHDRITLSGTMVAVGVLYAALSWWGIRRGQVWARDALLASGFVGFPTLFYFFAYRYVEPVHVALAAVLFPLFLLAVWRKPRASFRSTAEERDGERTRALVGQLLMVTVGAGLVIGGLTISIVGLTSVFVPPDLAYMNTSAGTLGAANDRLLSFIAHDRAGFGGALISTGVAVFFIAAWGWERGQAWVWWSLATGAVAGFGAALAIHIGVAYTDFGHLAPLYAGILFTFAALALGRPSLLANDSDTT